jgi:hypothetical protein
MKQFYLTFPKGSTIPPDPGGGQKSSALLSRSSTGRGSALLSRLASGRDVLFPPLLGWTHYQIIIRVENSAARASYEIEAAREAWSGQELEHPIASLLFERLAKSRNKDEVLALARKGHGVSAPRDTNTTFRQKKSCARRLRAVARRSSTESGSPVAWRRARHDRCRHRSRAATCTKRSLASINPEHAPAPRTNNRRAFSA